MKDKIINHACKIFIVIVALLIFVTVFAYEARVRNELKVLSYPTFVGEIIAKESRLQSVGMGSGMQITQFRLHIVGTYIDGDEIRQVDRVLVVPGYLYHQFDVGDIIKPSLISNY